MAPDLTVKKIIKHGEERFLVDMRGSKGGRKFFKKRSKAIIFASKKQAEITKLGEAAHSLTDEERSELVLAKQRLGGRGTIMEAVECFLATKTVAEPVTIAKALKTCVDEKEQRDRRPTYITKLKWVIGALAAAVPKRCHEITRADLETWLGATGWAAGTKKYALPDIRTFFRYCQRKGWTKTNPAEGIEPFTPEDKPVDIFTVAECRTLMETVRAKHRDLLGYFTLALFSGIRPEELKKMEWASVDIDRSFVEVPAAISKTRRRRITKLEPNAVAWLKVLRKREGDIAGRNWRKRWLACRKAAKVRWSHDILRHSFASYHIAKFGSADKTATEMGHGDTTMLFNHYRELVKPEDANAFWEIRP